MFGPVLSGAATDSVGIVGRMISGGMRGVPRIGLEIVDVRDLVDAHVRAMTAPQAAGERFLVTGEFTWMSDAAELLREGQGERGRKMPTQQLPDVAVRLAARFVDPSLREIVPALGRRNRHSTEKVRWMLGWNGRPVRQTLLDCAESLIAHGAVSV